MRNLRHPELGTSGNAAWTIHLEAGTEPLPLAFPRNDGENRPRTNAQPENEKPATANAVAGFDLVGARGFEPLRTHGGIRLSGECVGQSRHEN